MSDIKVTSPVQPHELDKKMRTGLDKIVDKVAMKSVVEGLGKDLLLRVYMSGVYHGYKLGEGNFKK